MKSTWGYMTVVFLQKDIYTLIKLKKYCFGGLPCVFPRFDYTRSIHISKGYPPKAPFPNFSEFQSQRMGLDWIIFKEEEMIFFHFFLQDVLATSLEQDLLRMSLSNCSQYWEVREMDELYMPFLPS